MAEILAWLVHRFRPREGWPPFLLILTAVLCLPAALLIGGDGSGATGLIVLTGLAVLLGLRLVRSRLSARYVILLGGLLGVGLAILVVGRLLPPLSVLADEIGYTARWLQRWRRAVLGWPLPLASPALFVWQQINALGIRIWWWVQIATGGGQAQNRVVLQLLSAFLVWSFALFATWQIYRRRAALLGLLPSGIVTAIVAFFQGGMAIFYLVTYLFCTLWLVAICHLWTNRDRWEQRDTDHPGGLGTELTLALAPFLTLVIIAAAFLPVVYVHPVREAFWRAMDAPWSRVERVAEQFFGPIESGYASGVSAGTSASTGGGLPRSHLLGSGPELGETVVLYVSTTDLPPPPPPSEGSEESQPAYPRRYWRSETYDVYTGQGWTNSPLQPQPISPNQSLAPVPPSGTDLFQQIQRIAPGQPLVFAVNAPYRVDSPVQVWQRAPGDLAYLSGAADLYTVVSRPPEPTIAELRSHSPVTATLPVETADRYLALPDTIPQRVLDLAREVASNAPTRYDRARAIERYLRGYAYSLDLPDPPTDRDLVDYFLFDLQEGYCDYFASSMVVMVRAVGVPARLASGYVQGTYDQEAHRWVVTEQDGHSWVEVYFDGIGWLEFEPTAGRPALERPGAEDLAGLTLPPLPPRPARWWQRVPWAMLVLGGVLLLLLAAVVWIWRPRPTLTPADLVRDRQARLLRWGARLGQPLRDGQTPGEYAGVLGVALRDRGRRARLPQARQAADQAPAEVEHLSEAFVRTQYSPDPIPDREVGQIRDLWTRLRRQLWWIWLISLTGKNRKQTR
jgi:transglutaminase-like putative cysteine protease